MAPVMIGAAIIGAGIKAYGDYQAGQAKAAQYGFEADVNRKLAQIATQNANWDIVSGEVKAQQAGLVSRAAVGRDIVSAGARGVDITRGATAGVVSSQIAIGRENQAIQRADAAHAAYGEEVQAAEKTATAGAMEVAKGTTEAAIPWTVAGDVFQGIATAGSMATQASSVSPKWYMG